MGALTVDGLPEFVVPPVDLDVSGTGLAIDTLLVRRLARQVKTPEQFEQILGTIDNDELRAAIRALLVPMLPFTMNPGNA